MSFAAEVYNVMIASPSDVNRERKHARHVIQEWNVLHAAARRIVLLPLGWETHATPSLGATPQSIINRDVLRHADLVIGIFWTRLGTATASHASGTVEELERHIATGKPAMLYFSAQPVHLDSIDIEQYERLKQFKEQVKQRGLLESYASPEEFRDKFYRHLQIKTNDRGYFSGRAVTAAPDVEGRTFSLPISTQKHTLSPDATRLLRAGTADEHGQIIRRTDVAGVSIYSNKESFFNHGDARSLARWEAALAELERLALIESSDYRRDIFRVTHRGYDVADGLG